MTSAIEEMYSAKILSRTRIVRILAGRGLHITEAQLVRLIGHPHAHPGTMHAAAKTQNGKPPVFRPSTTISGSKRMSRSMQLPRIRSKPALVANSHVEARQRHVVQDGAEVSSATFALKVWPVIGS